MAVRNIIEIDHSLCNACGQCIPSCAENALFIEDNKLKIREDKLCDGLGACLGVCPKNALKVIQREAEEFDPHAVEQAKHCDSLTAKVSVQSPESSEKHVLTWPVKLSLISPKVDFLQNAHLCFVADCAAYACSSFHKRFAKENVVLISCPRLENKEALVEKIALLLPLASKISIVRMEVPCCVLPELIEKAQQKASTAFTPQIHVLSRDGKEHLPKIFG